MRAEYSPDVLFIASAKKKPRLQALLDNLPNMSQEDIDNLNEPRWIRQSLTILKMRGGKDQKEFLNDLIIQAKELDDKDYAEKTATKFPIRKWNTSDTLINGTSVGSNKGFSIEIRHNEPFLLKDSSTIVLAGDFINLPNSEMHRIMSNSIEFSEMTLQEYFNHYNVTYLSSRF